MKKLLKRFAAFCFSATLLCTMGIFADAATYPYSVKVQNNNVLFIAGGQTVGSYAAKSADVVLTTDSGKNLLVCFYNKSNQYTRITLGSQKALTVQGTLSSLTLDKNLEKAVTVTVSGKVSTLSSAAPVAVTVGKGAAVTTAKMTNKSAKLTVASGATVTNASVPAKTNVSGTVGKLTVGGSTTTGTTGGTVKIRSNGAILTSKGTSLSSLTTELNDHVNAYQANQSIDGRAKWTSSGTKVNKTGFFDFTFTPTNRKYSAVKGTIKVILLEDYDDEDSETGNSDYSLDIKSITGVTKNVKLRELDSDLNHYVKAYDSDGDRVDGSCEWTKSGSTKVTKSGSYQFTFEPDDDDYAKLTGTIKVYVGNDTGNADELTVKVTDITTTSSSLRLSNFTNTLNSNVKVYDEDGDKVSGTCKWVSTSSTKVTKSADYEFIFTPTSSKYDSVRREIHIKITGGGSDIELRFDPIETDYDTKRLSSYLSDLEDTVRAYNDGGDKLSGTVSWVTSSSTVVDETDTFKFKFVPSSSKYSSATGSIKIIVDGDSDSELDLDIDDLYVSSSSKTLNSLREDLNDAVTAENDDGDTVRGTCTWVKSNSTKVTRSGYYEFKFKPSSSKYSTVTDRIYIEVDD